MMSLKQFVVALSALTPDFTAVEIADARWLAKQSPADGLSGATAEAGGLMKPRLMLLNDGTTASARDFARALGPLKREVSAPGYVLLDENATAERIARAGLRLPVLMARSERWLDLALIIDDGPSMTIWQDTAAEFRAILEKTGIFRDVRAWWLNTDARSGDPLLLRSGVPATHTMIRSPWEVIDPGRRRAILVFSDGISRAWRDRRMPRMLEQWGRAGHVSIVQPLPQRLWPRCAPALAAVRIHTARPMTENARFATRYRHIADPGDGYRHRYGERTLRRRRDPDPGPAPGASLAGPLGIPGGRQCHLGQRAGHVHRPGRSAQAQLAASKRTSGPGEAVPRDSLPGGLPARRLPGIRTTVPAHHASGTGNDAARIGH